MILEAEKFVEHFNKEYIRGWKKNWSFARSISGLTRSNGNSDGFNIWFEGKFNENKKLPLHLFFPEFFKAVKYISERFNPIVYPFPSEYELSNNKKHIA